MSEDLERTIGRGITQKEVGDNSLGLLWLEIFITCALVTVGHQSLLIFFLSMIAAFFLTLWKKTLVLLMIVFSVFWGYLGYSLFEWANSIPWAGAAIFFIVSMFIHLPAIDGIELYK